MSVPERTGLCFSVLHLRTSCPSPLYTVLSPSLIGLKWGTVNSVPLSDRALLRSLHEHVQEQRASDHRGDHTYGDTGGTNHSSDAVAHDEECTSNVAVIGLRLRPVRGADRDVLSVHIGLRCEDGRSLLHHL